MKKLDPAEKRVSTGYTITPQHKERLDSYYKNRAPRYKRIRSDILDAGIKMALEYVESNGPEIFYKNIDKLTAVVKQ